MPAQEAVDHHFPLFAVRFVLRLARLPLVRPWRGPEPTSRPILADSFVRPFLVIDPAELIEQLLLLTRGRCSVTNDVGLQFSVRPLVPAVVLGLAWPAEYRLGVREVGG